MLLSIFGPPWCVANLCTIIARIHDVTARQCDQCEYVHLKYLFLTLLRLLTVEYTGNILSLLRTLQIKIVNYIKTTKRFWTIILVSAQSAIIHTMCVILWMIELIGKEHNYQHVNSSRFDKFHAIATVWDI